MLKQRYSVDGIDLFVMLSTGAAAVERELSTLNQINVFPVPDADTGTNLLHTVRAANAAMDSVGDSKRRVVGTVAASFARGAFTGARGNSGVILAEILRGFSDALAEVPRLDPASFVLALGQAAEHAYRAVSQPVEGTMLTVIRDTARAVKQLANAGGTPAPGFMDLLDCAVHAAKQSVENTPNLLPVLRDHGVVDSGALGVAIFLEGMRRGAGGDYTEPPRRTIQTDSQGGSMSDPVPGTVDDRADYGFCTEFVISGDHVDDEEVRARFEPLGDSVVIAGGSGLVRVHLHTADPGAALSMAIGLGNVHDISVNNMDRQHEKASSDTGAAGIISFAPGDGFLSIGESLGASVRLYDPSGPDPVEVAGKPLLDGSDAELIVVPGDHRMAEVIRRVAETSRRVIHVVDAFDPPSGVSALMAYTYGATATRNLESMNAAAASVVVARAASDDLIDTALRDLPLPGSRCQIATLYYGAAVAVEVANRVAERVAAKVGVDLCEAIYGGQSDPAFWIALE